MTSPGPAFHECTGFFHKNVPALKAVSSHLRSTDGLMARIEIVTILIHYAGSHNRPQFKADFISILSNK